MSPNLGNMLGDDVKEKNISTVCHIVAARHRFIQLPDILNTGCITWAHQKRSDYRGTIFMKISFLQAQWEITVISILSEKIILV